MKCIMCRKFVSEGEICVDCDCIMAVLYREMPVKKQVTLNLFRETWEDAA